MSTRKKSKSEEPFDYLQKIIIIGDSGVGKSNILLRYNENRFVENYMMTIGINYSFKIITVDNVKIKLQIWDTAGQDKYKTITKNYYKNSDGVFIVFSIDSLESFHSVRNWIEELTQAVTESTQILLVGNKMDLQDFRQVSIEEATLFAQNYNIPYIECSAKSGKSIEQAFMQLGRMIKERIIDKKLGLKDNPDSGNVKLTGPVSNAYTIHQKCCKN